MNTKTEDFDRERDAIRRRNAELADQERERQREEQERRKINKEKAMKSLAKRNQKGFWEKYKDYFAYGALGAVVLFILISNFTGDRRKLADIPVNEESYIIEHNDANPPFKLGANEFFQGHTLANIKVPITASRPRRAFLVATLSLSRMSQSKTTTTSTRNSPTAALTRSTPRPLPATLRLPCLFSATETAEPEVTPPSLPPSTTSTAAMLNSTTLARAATLPILSTS